MLSELDSLYLDWIWQLDSVARLNNVWWANLRFDLGYDLNVVWLCTWFQVLGFSSCLYSGSGDLYVISGNLYLAIGFVYCFDQLVQLGHSASIHGSSLIWHFYIPAFNQYCIFQLQVQLYFHFQLDFLLPVLVFDKSLPDMFCSSPRCNALTSPRCNALLYRFRI